ncbi:SRPBCC family protein [Maribacter sp.]|nr:SRPBCC family protein [Maribacter sp.]
MTSSFKQTNYHFKYSIEVHNSQEKVWGFLTNVARWKDWDTELIESNLFGKFALGTEGALKPKNGPKLKFHISELIPNTSYTFKTKMPIGYLEIKRTLEKKGDTIEFTDDIQFTGFLKRVFGVMLGGGFKKVLPQVMENFKRLAEQE